MATHPISANKTVPTRLFTAADLAAMPTHLPSGDVDFELQNGKLLLMVPPGRVHGRLQSRLTTALSVQGEVAGHGIVLTETGFVLSRDPDTVVGPDIAFISNLKFPERESKEGYVETIPDLTVEIRSRNDTTAELAEKVIVYLAAGVHVVWVVDPTAKTVIAHKRNHPPQVLSISNTLTGDEIIPGFQLALADLFSI